MDETVVPTHNNILKNLFDPSADPSTIDWNRHHKWAQWLLRSHS